jgi:Animal haem peroxidase
LVHFDAEVLAFISSSNYYQENYMSSFGHGAVGIGAEAFTEILPPTDQGYNPLLLAKLASQMQGEIDSVKDIPDPEENILMPAGYTYFGQFIDHDLTFDNTSSLNPEDSKKSDQDISDGKATDRAPSNLRTPRFDLDSLYGDGPDAMPYMYAEDGASLLFKDSFANQCQTNYDQAVQDLLRSPNGRAIIGDKRNDENSIITQIQLVFIQYHNEVVKQLRKKDPKLTGTKLFDRAVQEVRWTYQKLVIEDFLPRIVKAEVLKDLQNTTPDGRKDAYALYKAGNRSNLPREFVVAAFRFGHSAVRTGYRLNKDTRLSIFPPSEEQDNLSSVKSPSEQSLLGFEPLPKAHVIDDWQRFFPDYEESDSLTDTDRLFPKTEKREPIGKDQDPEANIPAVRLQFAYKLDPTLVDPLSVLPNPVLPTSRTEGGAQQEVQNQVPTPALEKLNLDPNRPSLALLNLLRGSKYQVQGGQEIAKLLYQKGLTSTPSLDSQFLVTRQPVILACGTPSSPPKFKFEPIDSAFHENTPLWFYILAEAQESLITELKLSPGDEVEEKSLLSGAGAKTRLGWVGGRIIAEVFYGLIDEDNDSYQKAEENNWKPMLGGDGKAIFLNLIKFI